MMNIIKSTAVFFPQERCNPDFSGGAFARQKNAAASRRNARKMQKLSGANFLPPVPPPPRKAAAIVKRKIKARVKAILNLARGQSYWGRGLLLFLASGISFNLTSCASSVTLNPENCAGRAHWAADWEVDQPVRYFKSVQKVWAIGKNKTVYWRDLLAREGLSCEQVDKVAVHWRTDASDALLSLLGLSRYTIEITGTWHNDEMLTERLDNTQPNGATNDAGPGTAQSTRANLSESNHAGPLAAGAPEAQAEKAGAIAPPAGATAASSPEEVYVEEDISWEVGQERPISSSSPAASSSSSPGLSPETGDLL